MANKSILNPFTGAFDFVGEDLTSLKENVANLIDLTGVPANSETLGTFTGTTIPDNSTIKQAEQALETAVELKIPTAEKGQPSGVATLDVAGKVPVAQLPNSVMELQGLWDANKYSDISRWNRKFRRCLFSFRCWKSESWVWCTGFWCK
jgi:hypothetical protein